MKLPPEAIGDGSADETIGSNGLLSNGSSNGVVHSNGHAVGVNDDEIGGDLSHNIINQTETGNSALHQPLPVEASNIFDLVVASPEQTLEQLVNSFIYLTPEDVLAHNIQLPEVLLPSSATGSTNFDAQTFHNSMPAEFTSCILSPDLVPSPSQPATGQNACISTTDGDVLEELSTDGECRPPESLDYRIQVDNFMEANDDAGDGNDDNFGSDNVSNALGFYVPAYNVDSTVGRDYRLQPASVETCNSAICESCSEADDNGHLVPDCESHVVAMCTKPPSDLPPVTSDEAAEADQAMARPFNSTVDIIETFSLDPNFDYENVQHLTPKFSRDSGNVSSTDIAYCSNITLNNSED